MNTDVMRRSQRHRLYVNSASNAERLGELLGAEGLDFRGIRLDGECLSSVVVPSSDFTATHMAGAQLGRGNFADCKFAGTNLSGASFYKAILVHADTTGAVLRGAYLVRADLSDAVLRNAVLNGAELEGAHLCDADLRGASLRGCDLTKVHFDGVRVAGIDLRGAVNFWEEREHEIDVGEGDEPVSLTGRAARDWLLGRISPHGGPKGI